MTNMKGNGEVLESPARYKKLCFLGEGQFATVHKAEDVATGAIVAVKKIKLGSAGNIEEGINRTAIREIKFLKYLAHPNIVKLLDVFGHKQNINLVFEFLPLDLLMISNNKKLPLTQSHIKFLIISLLEGLRYLHINWIVHRDIKPNNLLLSSEGVLKIADFGLARLYGRPDVRMTSAVVTRWYRSPELLYGSTVYDAGVDIWSAGCVFAELLQKAPLFIGDSDIDQLNKIFLITGSPKETDWPEVTKLPDYVKFVENPGIPLSSIFPAVPDSAIQLLTQMLTLNPTKRISSQEALRAAYFSEAPHPSSNTAMIDLISKMDEYSTISEETNSDNPRLHKIPKLKFS